VASNAGCGAPVTTDPVNVKITNSPSASFTAPANACAGQNVEFKSTTSNLDPATTAFYKWNFGDAKSSIEKDPKHIYTGAGSFSVTLTVSYANNACANTSPAAPIIITTPSMSVAITTPGNKTEMCEGETLILQATAGFDTYTWSTGATTSSIEVSEAGNYSVEATGSGCTLTASKEISVIDAPFVTIVATPEKINEGETAQLTATGLDTYTWEPAESLSDPTAPNPVAQPPSTTIYTVTGIGTNGCKGTGTFTLQVTGEPIVNKLNPHNFFSPNNDGSNEQWQVDNILTYTQCGIVIYDEKGVKVFDAKPYHNDWNGTFNGKALPDGVYFYIIRCDGEEGTPRAGSITVLR
jgi:gliding motility-associated-like protein